MTERTMPIHRDYGNIVCSAVRYALGRHTYMVSLTANYVLDSWEYIDERSRFNIIRDIEEFIRASKEPPGWWAFDQETWERLLVTLKEKKAQ